MSEARGTIPTELVPIEDLWTAQDVADFLKASVSWVYKAAGVGTLPCIRIGAMLRFHPGVVRAWVAGQAVVVPSVKLPGCRG